MGAKPEDYLSGIYLSLEMYCHPTKGVGSTMQEKAAVPTAAS